jgi:gamma-glutamyltranspeptidase / glutathione hydrolase
VPETGISLQNRASGFSLEPGHPNQVAGGKRPFHTIIPGFIMRQGRPHMAFGVMGGPIQAQAHIQIFLRTQIWNQDPQTAAEAPRWRFINGVNAAIEPDAGADVMAALEARGHRLTPEAPEENFGFGGAQLVCAVDGGFVAGSDPRKDGQAAGF